ncbi:MAG: Calx-beta domain-containing protein, partial [Desulfuromonadaceae bacterium]|nr:Calx-beta domain-containing protein [Desulfuromonadaceae bacterium]
MGQVIKKKLNGMSWWMKTSLVLLLTMATTVFMYQGWYQPKDAKAAVITYYMQASTASTIGVDSPANLPAGSPSSFTGYPAKTVLGTAETGTGSIYYPAGFTTSGSTYIVERLYAPVYASAMDISNISASMAIRPAATNEAVSVSLYDYDPAGTAGNKTLVATGATKTLGTAGTTAQTTWAAGDFTINGTGRVASGHSLLIETSYTYRGTAGVRFYFGITGTATSTNFTVTETAAATAGSLAVSATTQTVAEAVGNATITVNRTGGSTGAVTVDYTTADGTGTASQDYTSTSGTLSWADGDAAAKTITVPILNDSYDEGSETFTVTLSNATNGATLGTATQTVTITDDDGTPTIGFISSTSTGNKSVTPAVFTVQLSAASGQATAVNYATSNGTATAGVDYTAISGTLNIPALSTSGTINVPVSASSNGGTFVITLTTPVNSTLGTATHTYTITAQAASTITNCNQCHNGYPSLTDSATRVGGSTGSFPGSHSVASHGTTCTLCHSSNTTFDHSSGTIDMAGSISGGSYSRPSGFAVNNDAFTPGTCNTTNCHGTLSPTWGSVSGGAECAICHSDVSDKATFTTTARTTNSASSTIHVSHLNNTHAITTKVITCADCHAVPGTVDAAGHNDTALPAEASVAGYNGTTCSSATACHRTKVPTWAVTITGSIDDCLICHDLPPASHSVSAVTNFAGLSTCSSNGTGTGCHPTINEAPTAFNNIFFDNTLHINGTVEGGSCTGCHDTGGDGAKGNRLAITPQFGAGYSHHYQGAAAVDGTVCYQCHWESDATGGTTSYHQGTAGGVVDLVIWNATTRPIGPTYTVSTGVAYTSGGATDSLRTELAKINSHCIGCHNDGNKGITPFSALGDTNTPVKYSWEALATTLGGLGGTAQSIAAKYSDPTTTLWGKFTGNYTNTKNSQTKAYSAHGNAASNQRGWNTLAENAQDSVTVANYPNTSGSTATSQVLCFDCHNSHGSDLTGVVATTSYDSATGIKKGGILKQTTANKGGYSVTYKPTDGGSAGAKNLYNNGAALCFDCHNNLAAATATDAGGGSTPWGYGTYGAT